MLKTVSSIANAIGALNYKGTWDAATNTPTLTSGNGTKGDYYQVSVEGSTTLDGISNWGVGDVAAFNGITWQRIEGGADLNGVNLTVTGTSALATATATTLNKVALTAPATGSTLTIADGKTLTANNSLTLAGTDATTMTFPTSNATVARTDAAQTFTGNQSVTGESNATTAFRETGALTANTANGATRVVTLPTPRRPQLLTVASTANIRSPDIYLLASDGAGNVVVYPIVTNSLVTVAGTAGNQVTITNTSGVTCQLAWSLLPLMPAL
jgi:hypothetical protein